MFSLDHSLVRRRMRDLLARLGNLPAEQRDERIREHLESDWGEMAGKAERYVQGEDVLTKGGHFSAMSCGNWFLVADAAGVERVPARAISVVNPVMLLAMASDLIGGDEASVNRFFAAHGDEFARFVNDLQGIGPNEILRYDAAASAALKAEMAIGRADGLIPAYRGYRKRGAAVFPDIDERVLNATLSAAENSVSVWAREWVKPRMMEGDRDSAIIYERAGPDGQGVEARAVSLGVVESAGRLFPREWRAFVKNGQVAAVGNYYTQIRRAATEEDEADAACAAMEVRLAAEAVIQTLRDSGAVPHHPQYEMRDGLDPDAVHFTLDFMEVPDESADFGRRLVLVDAGVAHLRAPAFGAHPVSFGHEREPEGVAFGFGDVRSWEEVKRISDEALWELHGPRPE